MDNLLAFYPTAADLLAVEIEDLAPLLLKYARATMQRGMFQRGSANDKATGRDNPLTVESGYSNYDMPKIDAVFSETWAWIEREGLISSAPDYNGQIGWMIFTRKGEAVSDAADFARLRQIAALPKSLLHSSIAEKVWRTLMRNDLDDAVLFAFKAVEEAVRQAARFSSTDRGVPLMRKAFDKSNGPLSNQSDGEGQREHLAHLFAGAFGYFRNPNAHETVGLTDPQAAYEQIILASLLLRIVDDRR
jgi:uncharacterized protein (TIGR02391 family)